MVVDIFFSYAVAFHDRDSVRSDASDEMPEAIRREWLLAGTEFVAGGIGIDQFLDRVEAAWGEQ
jgi:hypothetical protein